MKIALITALVLIVVFIGGLLIGMRLTAQPDAVTNSMLQEKIDQDVAGLNRRLEGMDSKLDILLNVATNGYSRGMGTARDRGVGRDCGRTGRGDRAGLSCSARRDPHGYGEGGGRNGRAHLHAAHLRG